MPKPPKGATQTLGYPLIKELTGATPAQRANIVDELDQRWCSAALDFSQRAQESAQAGKSFDARNWTWAAGVATDKVFAIREIPTQTVAHLHEHRVSLPDVMDKLAAAGRILTQHRARGFQPVSARVGNVPALPSPVERA